MLLNEHISFRQVCIKLKKKLILQGYEKPKINTGVKRNGTAAAGVSTTNVDSDNAVMAVNVPFYRASAPDKGVSMTIANSPKESSIKRKQK